MRLPLTIISILLLVFTTTAVVLAEPWLVGSALVLAWLSIASRLLLWTSPMEMLLVVRRASGGVKFSDVAIAAMYFAVYVYAGWIITAVVYGVSLVASLFRHRQIERVYNAEPIAVNDEEL